MRLAFLSIVLWTFSSIASADEPKVATTTEAAESIIAVLRSRNSPPKISEGGQILFSKQFNRSWQEDVHSAWDRLVDSGVVAFPALIAHLDDEAYCTAIASPLSDYWHNITVGGAAREILYNQIQPYGHWTASDESTDPRRRATRPNYVHMHLGDQAAAKKWWEANKERDLREIQIDALKWVIAQESAKADDFSNFERKSLQDKLLNLQKSRKPLPPGNASFIYRIGEDN